MKKQIVELLSTQKCQGADDSFFATIWWYCRVSQLFGHVPVKISFKDKNFKVEEKLGAQIYFVLISVLSSSFMIYSHLMMNHKHSHFYDKNPIILRVTYYETVTVLSTATIGTINIFVMRKLLVKVIIFC